MPLPARQRDRVTRAAVLAGYSNVGCMLVLLTLAQPSLRAGPTTDASSHIDCASHADPEARSAHEPFPALHHYATRVASFRQRALATGTVTYADVLKVAYGPGAIDLNVLEGKARWRATHRQKFAFVTDYSDLQQAVEVHPLVAVPDPNLQSTLVAQYESTTHQIGIAPMAGDFTIFHEAGHALQRAILRTRGTAGAQSAMPDFPSARKLHPATADVTAVRRLKYLCSQDEFEVRLQDLNRFHALLVAGRPILSATDSLRAVTALGMSLGYEETRDAYHCAGEPLSSATFAACTASAPIDAAAIGTVFEDARELCLLRQLTLQIDPACWPPLLAKILFEAPGHL